VRGPTGDEPAADLAAGIELTASKSASASDGVARPIVCRSLGLEQGQHALRAARRPRRDEPAIRLAQGLG
jgi:hypothetical protein